MTPQKDTPPESDRPTTGNPKIAGVYPKVSEHGPPALPGQTPETAIEDSRYSIRAGIPWWKVALLGAAVAPLFYLVKFAFGLFNFALYTSIGLRSWSALYIGMILPAPLVLWALAALFRRSGVPKPWLVALGSLVSAMGLVGFAWALVPVATKSGNASLAGYAFLLLPLAAGALLTTAFAFLTSRRTLIVPAFLSILLIAGALLAGSLPVSHAAEKAYVDSLVKVSFTPLKPAYVPAGAEYTACDQQNGFGSEKETCSLLIRDPTAWLSQPTQANVTSGELASLKGSQVARVMQFRYHPWLAESLPKASGGRCDLGEIMVHGGDTHRHQPSLSPGGVPGTCEKAVSSVPARYTIWAAYQQHDGRTTYNNLYAQIGDRAILVTPSWPDQTLRGGHTVDELVRMINSFR